jgi:urease accessory protein
VATIDQRLLSVLESANMIEITRILGHCDDPDLSARIHHAGHHGGIEYLHIPPAEAARRRFRAVTDMGSECAVMLPRDQGIFDGAVLLLEHGRAVVVRLTEQRWLRLRPSDDEGAGLELGYHAGNLHWRVRFDHGDLLVALDGPRETYLARLADLMDEGKVEVVGE